MKPDRQQLIESLATGNITDILKKSPYKFMFTVFVEEQPDGTISYEMEVQTLNSETTHYTTETRKGKGNYEDAITPDERKYMELCRKIRRVCCFIISS